MIDKKSFKDKELKNYYQGDVSKVGDIFHSHINLYLQAMNAPQNPMSLVKKFPGYHPYKKKTKGVKTHSLPLTGNYRLLFSFDKKKQYFFKIYIHDPHKK